MDCKQPLSGGIAICAAMRWELRPVLRNLPQVRLVRATRPRTWLAKGPAAPILVFQTGIGMDAAAESTRSILSEFSPAAIINTGCAGSLSPSLAAGAIVCGAALIAGDDVLLQRYPTSPTLTFALCQASLAAGLRPLTQPILTSRDPLLTPEGKADAFARCGAVAVEMEGAAIAQAAVEAGVELASIRVILDDAGTALPASRFHSKTMFDFARNVASAILSAEEVTDFSVTAKNVLIVDRILGSVFKSFLRTNV